MKMTLKQWLENRWLQPHRTSFEEIENLFKIVERDLKDARAGVSADWRFGIAYNAALKLCTILLYVGGYRAEKSLQHYRTIQALPKILGPGKKIDASYLDACRSKRNTAEYDSVGAATENEADELIDYVESLREEVVDYLKTNFPEYIL
jgi:uncharacterized protein (UPF0332 family)